MTGAVPTRPPAHLAAADSAAAAPAVVDPGAAEPYWYPLPSTGEAVRRVTEAFVARYGRSPDGVWAAPGRVNVIGEHVDYNAGLALPFALPHRTFAAVALRADDVVRVRSAQVDGGWEGGLGGVVGLGEVAQHPKGHSALPGAGGVEGWAGYAVGVPWALRQAGFDVPGADIMVDGRVPLGSGLSSSAALECAVALGFDELAGLGLAGDDAGRTRLVAACRRAETEIVGVPTGGLDQAASLRCRAGHAMLLDCRDFTAELMPFDLAAVGLELLIIDTRAHHALADGQYGSRRQACEQAARILGVATLREVPMAGLDAALARLPHAELRRRVRHVVTEIDRVAAAVALLDAGRIADVGPLLDASHASLRDDYEVSCAELDLACTTAVAAGALGARMTGGGFGGSAVALVPAGDVERVAAEVAAAFDAAGVTAPVFLRAEAAGPAGRIG